MVSIFNALIFIQNEGHVFDESEHVDEELVKEIQLQSKVF